MKDMLKFDGTGPTNYFLETTIGMKFSFVDCIDV